MTKKQTTIKPSEVKSKEDLTIRIRHVGQTNAKYMIDNQTVLMPNEELEVSRELGRKLIDMYKDSKKKDIIDASTYQDAKNLQHSVISLHTENEKLKAELALLKKSKETAETETTETETVVGAIA